MKMSRLRGVVTIRSVLIGLVFVVLILLAMYGMEVFYAKFFG